MNRITALIIDDEAPVRKRLENLLSCFNDIEILASTGNPEIAVFEITKKKPDLVFLDIEMPGCNGFEIIKRVNGAIKSPTYIFVTGYSHYAIKAIKRSAFDYILKPVSIDELSESLDRYRKTISDHAEKVEDNPRFDILSNREKEVLQQLYKGHSSKEIAQKLFISKNTVDTHRRAILKKLNLSSTIELIGTH